MSARYFCDVCEGEIIVNGNELLGPHAANVRGRIVNIEISIIFPAGMHDICKSCALDALAKLDDRPGVSK